MTTDQFTKIKTLMLARSSHGSRKAGMCAMEAVAFLAGEPHSDAPKCTAAPVRRFVIATNDWCNDEERQQLKPYLLRLITTSSGGREADKHAAFLFADWAVREVAPAALDARNKPELAARLRAIAPIVDKASAIAARDETYEVRKAAYAAAATYAAAYAAAAADAAAAAYAAADAAAYAAAYAAADADADARQTSLAGRLTILDRVLTQAYGK